MKKRYYGLDALRILAMVFVVIVLYSISHSGVSSLVDRNTFNWYTVYFIQYACLAAVNCFVLLSSSSYFPVASRFNVREAISFSMHAFENKSMFAGVCNWSSSRKYIALMENDFSNQQMMNATQYGDNTTLQTSPSRNINIDILRIVAMFAVVVLYFFGVGRLLSNLKPLSANWWLGNLIEYTAFPAVNCYVLISGYFLCTSKFRIKKLVDLWIQVFMYAIVFYIIGTLLNHQLLTPKNLIKAVFPISTNYLWFATAYFGLYCCFPFLNISIYSITEKQFRYLLLTFFILLSLLPSVTLMYDPIRGSNGFALIWFVFLYYSAAYIRIYQHRQYGLSQSVLLAIFFLATLALVLCKGFVQPYMMDILNTKYRLNLFSYTSMFVFIQSISIFCFFRNLKVKSYRVQKTVASVSPLIFGVYLYHNHPAVRNIIWRNIFSPANYADSPYMIPYMVFAVSSVFIAGLLIDYVRLKISSFIDRTSIPAVICGRLSLIKFVSSMESTDTCRKKQIA